MAYMNVKNIHQPTKQVPFYAVNVENTSLLLCKPQTSLYNPGRYCQTVTYTMCTEKIVSPEETVEGDAHNANHLYFYQDS